MKKYKAVTPEKTVENIQYILSRNQVPVVCSTRGDGDLFCSYRLSITNKDDETIGTNGKGMTPIYAMASAYAEMMERFQNRVVIYPNPAWIGKDYRFFPDEENKHISQKEIIPLVKKYTPRVAPSDDHALPEFDCRFVPFFHINTKSVDMLPYSILRWVNGSNGMCAGNIPEEAMIQGFNEIFERYALQEIYLRRLTPPDIPAETFSGTSILNNLERMRQEYGMTYRIKDCSLGEGFPVIGLLIYNSDKSKYIVQYGADLSLRVALERCFTEIFQGHTAQTLNFENELNSCESLDLFNEFKRSLVYGRGRMPIEFFGDAPSYEFDINLHIKVGANFKEDLSNIVRWLLDRNYNIYIRDNSFMGFPAYHICVPGLSDIDKAFCRLADRIADKQLTENSINPLWRLPLLSNEQLGDAVFLLEKMDKDIVTLAPHNRNKNNNVNRMLLLMLIYYKLGDDAKTLEYLCQYINKREVKNMAIPRYYYAIRNKLLGIDISEAFERNDIQIAEQFLDNRESALKNSILPTCNDCTRCLMKEGCRYEFLQRVEDSARMAMQNSHIDQSQLSLIF